MKLNKSFRFCQALNFATNDLKLKFRVENWCEKNNKKLILSEPKSPDIIAYNAFVVIADPVFVGEKNMDSFIEFEKEKLFDKEIYEDAEKYKFFRQYFDLDENGKFFIEPKTLLLTNELNNDEIISKLDEFVELYKNNFTK